jgi:hypothetical protein
MKVAAVLIVLAGAAFLYVQLRGSGESAPLPGYHQSQYQPNAPNSYMPDRRRMSAKALEKLLDEETLHWAPNRPVHMRCAKRRRSSWDYVCNDTHLSLRFGIDVDGVGVTSFVVLSPKRG